MYSANPCTQCRAFLKSASVESTNGEFGYCVRSDKYGQGLWGPDMAIRTGYLSRFLPGAAALPHFVPELTADYTSHLLVCALPGKLIWSQRGNAMQVLPCLVQTCSRYASSKARKAATISLRQSRMSFWHAQCPIITTLRPVKLMLTACRMDGIFCAH